MIQFRILDSNYVFQTDTTLSATSTNPNFPLTNLRKYHRSKVWRSAGYFVISTSNNKIDFKESSGGSELTATLTSGNYTVSQLETEIKDELEAVGADTYTVSYSEQTGLWTISSNGSFLSLLFSSGTNTANSVGSTLGFNADCTGSLSYSGSEVALHTEEAVVIDCSVTSQVDSFAIVFDPLNEMPLTQNAQLRLQANATNTWSSPSVDVALSIDFDRNVVTHFFSSTQSYRYWRVKVVDPNNPELCVELPKIILSKATQLTQSPEIGFKHTIEDQSTVTRTPYGHEYYDVYPLRRSMDFSFAMLSETDLIELERIFRTVGNSVPICVALDPLEEVFDDKDRVFIYGRIRNSHIQTHKFYTYYDVDLSISETI
jgi:hypothetical protein